MFCSEYEYEYECLQLIVLCWPEMGAACIPILVWMNILMHLITSCNKFELMMIKCAC